MSNDSDDGGFSLVIDHSDEASNGPGGNGGNGNGGGTGNGGNADNRGPKEPSMSADQGTFVLNLHDDEPEEDRNQPAPELQTVVQINIYRFQKDHFEYLLLKKIDDDDNFWLPVTEPVPGHETIAMVTAKAAQEQIGVVNFKRLSQEMYSYEWYSHGQRGRDIVFTAELTPETVVAFDKSRFSTAEWLPLDQALENLKWSGNKEALRQLDKRLNDKYAQDPEFFTAMAPPSQTGISKRLPDAPENTGKTGDPNVMEWFL